MDIKSKQAKSYLLWIDNAYENNVKWENIIYGGGDNDEYLQEFLDKQSQINFWNITIDEWKDLVEQKKKIIEKSSIVSIYDPDTYNEPVIGENGAFRNYLNKLLEQGFTQDSVNNIEDSAIDIMSHLNMETVSNDPFRGLVVGNVQSGKTANMAALISLAADQGFNFFIVLSGTIENLRIQTEERLNKDLYSNKSNINFNILSNLSGKTSINDLSGLHLEESDHERYLTVCLKNSTRLNNLLKWLNKDAKKKAQLKVLLIDDEADQAGINTQNIDKKLVTRINDLIKKIVFAANSNGSTVIKPYKCLNYVAYTATPYANILNEASEESLYPKNLISTLSCSNEYFGPQQIFGSENSDYDGLSIINEIPSNDVAEIESLSIQKTPSSLKEAIMWFLCTVAYFRHYKIYKPVSMLVHTSQYTESHIKLAKVIKNEFDNMANDSNIFSKIEEVYNNQTKQFSKEIFRSQYNDYGRDDSSIKDYPAFNEIKDTIKALLDKSLQSIMIDDSNDSISFSDGIHLCIDNSKVNPTIENEHLRLVYPKNGEIEFPGPAFIVIGGATLSRGLTLEGLTTTYFLRNSQMADTLMQMGRWFGYRRDYELMPRLWISEKTRKQFEFLAQFDEDLRIELQDMSVHQLKPSQYAPRLSNFPKYAFLKITSKNKMQKSIIVDGDFLEYSGQTTTMYLDNNIIEENFDKTVSFINSLGDIDNDYIYNELNTDYNSLVWLDVDHKSIFNYISTLKYPEVNSVTKDIPSIKKWYETNYNNGLIEDFNIILFGNKTKGKNDLEICGKKINLVGRSIYKPIDNIMKFGVISAPEAKKLDIDQKNIGNLTLKDPYKIIRSMPSYKKKPVLIIYIIDKDSEVEPSKKIKYGNSRVGLNTKQHVVGYEIYIPKGDDGKIVSSGKVTVNLEFDLESGDINES